MDNNVQDLCRVCRSDGSTEKPMYHPCICTGNIATIKRKPSFTPKIPLTSTTRNLAKQSDNALLDIKISSGDDEKLLRNGTLRLKRPSTHERLNSINMKVSTITTTPQVQSNNNHQPISPKADEINCLRRRSNNNNDLVEDDDLDDYPLPPPPETLTASLSCLSLNSLPPPPSEFLDESAINNGCSIDYHDDFNTTYIQRPTSITSSKSSVGSSQSPSRRHSNAKPIASPVVPPKPHGLNSNGRIYESINPVNNNMNSNNNNNNYNYDDTRSTNDTISISSCDSNSTSNISSVGTSSSDSNISNRYQMIRISNPPTEMITKNTSESQISLSSSSSSIHQNNIQQPVTAQSIVTTPQSKSEYQFQPHPVRNNKESNYHERTDEPIYQQIPAHIETNQPNIIYPQLQSQKSQLNKPQQQPFIQHPHNYQSQLQHQQQLQTPHYQLPANHSNYNQKQDSLDGPIYQEVPKNLVHLHHQNIYGINTINGNNMSINSNNSINITNNRESTISQHSSIGSSSSHSSNNSSPVIIANNHNPLNLESRSSNITANQTRNNINSNNNSIINNVNDCKMSTFNNKREIAASFNYPVPTRSPMRGPLPPPPEVFLRDIHRVMDKKWKVAQQLTLDSSQSVNQLISGYRDPYDQMIQMIQMNEILCLDELLNQQKPSPTPAYQQPQPQPQQHQPPPPSNHYEAPPSLNQNHHHYHHQQQIKLIQHQQQQQNYDNHYQSQHVLPSCQQIDELPEYDHNHLTKYTNNNQSNQTSNNLIISSTQSCNYNGANVQQPQQVNQDIPVPPPPPVLRCTNSSLFDKPLSRNKNGPPPPPRRSDKTRLSGRYQMRIETPNKPNQQ